MTYLTRERARELARAEVGPCLSLYLDFSDTRPADAPQRRARLERALDLLCDAAAGRFPGLSRDARVGLADPLRGVLGWERFWRHQSLGLALFSSATLCRVFRLPLRVRPRCVVESRFDLRPALPLLAHRARVRLLTLSETYTRLYDCTAEACRLLDWYDLPLGFNDALGFDGRHRSLRFLDGQSWWHGAPPLAVHSPERPRPWVRRVAHGILHLTFGPEVELLVGGHPALVREFAAAHPPGAFRTLDPASPRSLPTCAAMRRSARTYVASRQPSTKGASAPRHPAPLSSVELGDP